MGTTSPPASTLREVVPVPLQIDIPGLEIGPDDTVVDVGCGVGTVCAYAAKLGAAVIGIDADEAALAVADEALRRLPARSWRGIVSGCDPIPLPDASASVVIATEVLEHVDDPPRFLAELVRVGRPGARYVISVPDPASEAVMKAAAPGWYWRRPFHIHVYEHETLDALVRAAGLEPVGRASRGFHQSLWWAFRMALGAEVNQPAPDAPLLRHWDAAWSALMEAPGGPRVAEALDRAVPKSQLVLARKPGGTAAASSFGGPVWSRSRWKRRWRDGGVRLAGFDVRWSVRRARG
jgi:SAM-dependent methyltransferase